MKTFLFRCPENNFHFQFSENQQIGELLQEIKKNLGASLEKANFFYQNKKILDWQQHLNEFKDINTIQVIFPSLGGKGGFGQLMKNLASKLKKLNNVEASRDLQGRRISYVQYEEQLVDFFKKKKREDELVQKELDEYKKINETLNSGKFDVKMSKEFKDKLDEIEEKMIKSLMQGLNLKRKKNNEENEEQEYIQKKKQEREQDKEDTKNNFYQKLKQVQQQEKINEKYLNQQQSQFKIQDQKQQQKLEQKYEQIQKKNEEIDEVLIEKTQKIIVEQEDKKEEEKQQQNNGSIENQVQEKNEENKNIQQSNKQIKSFDPIELNKIKNVEQLYSLEFDHLKAELTRLGLRNDGNLQQKAKRLFLIVQNPLELLNPKLLAKK